MAVAQAYRTLEINTALGIGRLVIRSATVSESLSQLFQIEVEVTSDNPNISFDAIVGTNATIRFNLDALKSRYLNGCVSRFVLTDADRDFAHYRMTLVPWLWFLTRTSDCRIFQKKKIPDIIKEVFSVHGLSDFRLALTGTYDPWEYCVQYRETDFNFISRLMEHEGIYYFFEHENGKHTLVLADSLTAHKPKAGTAKLVYRSAAGGGARDQDYVSNFVVEQEVQPGAYALNEFNFEKPKTSLKGQSDQSKNHAQAKFEIYDYPGEYEEAAQGKGYSQIRIEEMHARFEVAHGNSNDRAMAVGSTFLLAEHPKQDWNKSFLITATSIHLQVEDYTSGGHAGEAYTCSFSAVQSTTQYRAPRLTSKPLIQGPQTAIVVGPAGEEIHTDKYARIKVQFHWDRYGKFDDNSSCWVRVSQAAWAGKKWGGIYIPRVGQEVMVEFLEGDPDRPIVSGRVYNADCMPPYDLPAEKTKTTLKSNSSKGSQGFNELRFEDKKGGEQIFIHGQHNMDVRVRNDLKETNYGNRHECIGWKTEEGSGGSHFVKIQQDENTHIVQKHYEKIDDESHLTVGGEFSEKLEKSFKLHVTESHVVNSEESILETAQRISLKTNTLLAQGASGVHVRGSQIVLEGDSICLVSGGNFVSVNAAGVQISGSVVTINSGGAALSSQPPATLPEIVVMEPLEASVAADAVGGSSGTYSGGTVKRGGGPVAPILAPPYVPPPKVPAPVTPHKSTPGDPPVVCAGPYRLTDQESRKSNSSYVLEVVPKSLFAGDAITVKSAGKCSCAGAQVRIGSTNTSLNVPTKVDGWVLSLDDFSLLRALGGATPESLPVALTCGKDKSSVGSGEIRVYPSDKVKIEVQLKSFCEKCPAVNSAILYLAKALSTLTGKNVDPYEGCHFNAGLFWINIPAPALSLNYEAEWKEYPPGSADEWKAYYSWKAGVSITIAVECRLDLIAVGLTATGVGASVAEVYEWIVDNLESNDSPPFYLGVKFELATSGQIGFEEKVFGSLGTEGTGTFSIGASISTEVVEVSLEAATSVSGKLEGKATSGGLSVDYEFLKWGGVQGKASVKLNIGKVFTVGYERSAQLIAGAGPLVKGNLMTI